MPACTLILPSALYGNSRLESNISREVIKGRDWLHGMTQITDTAYTNVSGEGLLLNLR